MEIKNKTKLIWLTGLPCSGKTTLGDALALKLRELNVNVCRLDGDIVRKKLWTDFGFSKEDRAENLRRVSELSKMFVDSNVTTIATFVSPYQKVRDDIREQFKDNFIEVFVKTSKDECIKRDVKGMWAKAISGEIKEFTGWDDPYEEPINPEITIETETESIDSSITRLINILKL